MGHKWVNKPDWTYGPNMVLRDVSRSTDLIGPTSLIWSYGCKWVNKPDWAYGPDITRRQPLAKITLLTDCEKTLHVGGRPPMGKIALLKDCEKTPHAGGKP